MDGPAWIVVPTYNEAANLEPLLAGVRASAPDARVLVVDDGSPDGTGEIAERLAAENASLEVMHRPRKAGLGLAYVNGFARALGPEAGQLHHRDQPRRDAGAQLLRGGDVARLVQRLELLLERLADARQLGDPSLAGEADDGHGGVADGLGGVAVGDHAVGDRAVELVEIAELVEGGGDLGVGEVGHGIP